MLALLMINTTDGFGQLDFTIDNHDGGSRQDIELMHAMRMANVRPLDRESVSLFKSRCKREKQRRQKKCYTDIELAILAIGIGWSLLLIGLHSDSARASLGPQIDAWSNTLLATGLVMVLIFLPLLLTLHTCFSFSSGWTDINYDDSAVQVPAPYRQQIARLYLQPLRVVVTVEVMGTDHLLRIDHPKQREDFFYIGHW